MLAGPFVLLSYRAVGGFAVATQCRLCPRAPFFKAVPSRSTASKLSHCECLGVAVALGSLFSLVLPSTGHAGSPIATNQPVLFLCSDPSKRESDGLHHASPSGAETWHGGHFDMLAAVSTRFPTSSKTVNTPLEHCFVCSLQL